MVLQFVKEHVLWWILLFAAVFTFYWLMQFRKRLRMSWQAALPLSLLHVVFGVACVRVFARLEGADAGAMSIFGAVFFMPIGYYLGAKLFKRQTAEIFDIFAVPMIFTLLCARVNCLFSGCCLGLPIGSTGLRWPTREAEMLFYLTFLLVEAPKVRKGKTRGEVYPLYMFAYGLFRFVVEFLRVSTSTNHPFHLSHAWAILSLVVGLAIVVFITKQAKRLQRKARKN